MDLNGFKEWLESQGKRHNNLEQLLKDAKRIEKEYEEDLDTLYTRDRLEGILAELRYTAVDKRQERPNPSKINTKPTSLGPYRTAAKRYQEFRDSTGDTVRDGGLNPLLSGRVGRRWARQDPPRPAPRCRPPS